LLHCGYVVHGKAEAPSFTLPVHARSLTKNINSEPQKLIERRFSLCAAWKW